MTTEHDKLTSTMDQSIDQKSTSKNDGGAAATPTHVERRSAERTRDDTDWESKVVGRLNGRLKHLNTTESGAATGWEADVLDALRKRIDRSSQ